MEKSCSPFSSSRMTRSRLKRKYEKKTVIETDVVIIGGGASGIAAAEIFHNGNVNFMVLEADTKIGGRIQSHNFGGNIIENGANWIVANGLSKEKPSFNLPIWNLKKKYDIKGNITDWGNAILLTNEGNKVNKTLLHEWLLKEREVRKLCMQKGELLWTIATNKKLQNPEHFDISMKECYEQYNYIDFELSKLQKSVASAVAMSEVDFSLALPSSNVSVMLVTLEELLRPVKFNCDEEYYFVTDQRGYNVFINRMARNFNTSIRLSHQVTRIDYDESGVYVKGIILDTNFSSKKEFEIRSKFAISTVSLGVLQKEVIEFRPPLTATKMEAIRGMHMGLAAKVFLKFPYNFWGDTENFYTFKSTWVLNLDHQKYFPGSNMITFHFIGDIAIRLESQDIAKTKLDLMQELHQLFGNSIPDPIDIHVTNWTKNPFYYGSWSSLPLGYTSAMRDELRKNEETLYFSGEHTNKGNSGFVQGAFRAGQTTAQDVLKKMKEQHPK